MAGAPSEMLPSSLEPGCGGASADGVLPTSLPSSAPKWPPGAAEAAACLEREGFVEVEVMETAYIANCDMQMRVFYHAQRRRVAALAVFGDRAIGPPGAVHGGAVFSVADHLFALLTNTTQKCRTFTANQSISLRRPVATGQLVRFDCWLDNVEERKGSQKLSVAFSVTAADAPQRVCSEGAGLWIAKLGTECAVRCVPKL
eukprot:TRINITY_DN7163_c0_g1_i1.p2 TRINITY_DN7163_c0_g1~~TRINITY_DN7163_c0_g1_i1.p2  ORF type:complete len:225 (+),score=73.10 TRINITY_DN7163_c0_g1_i1:75-677(+)